MLSFGNLASASKMSKSKTVKIIKNALSVSWWIALALLFVTMVSIFSAKIRGEVPRLFGYSVMHIISESMEEEIPKDSYILIKRTDPEDVRKGDVICFYSDDFTIQGYPNTHRVVEDPIITENGIEYVTRGDANPINDSVTAKGEKLIGKHVKNLDGLTKFAHALEGNTMIIIIGVILMASVVMITYTAVLESKKEATKKD